MTFSTLFLISTAIAAPPRIENITWEVIGTNARLEVTARYQGSGVMGDGVDEIQISVNGKIYNTSFTLPFYDDPQPTYAVQLDVSVDTGTPTVQARAHGPIDGWGDWSSAVTIPEFSTPFMVLLLAALILPVLSFRQSNRRKG